jgi:Ti type entry exclusion protein TrbK
VTTKAIPIAIAATFALAAACVWFLISEKQLAQERREVFFSATKNYPTSGGQKMKPAW